MADNTDHRTHAEQLVQVRIIHRRIPLSDPGIDDARNELLWSPDSPTLIDAHVEVVTRDGLVLDTFDSYTALRTIAVHNDQILLNGSRAYDGRLTAGRYRVFFDKVAR